MKRILVSRLVSASVIIAVIGALSVAAVALPGSPFDDNPSTPGEISGNCDEAEHANDVECGGDGTSTPGTVPASTDDNPSTPGEISGNCDEPEHFGDEGCNGSGGNAGTTTGTPTPPADDGTGPVEISGNCDEPEHFGDEGCNGSGGNAGTTTATQTSAPDAAAEVLGEVLTALVGQTQEIAGTVTYSFVDGTFSLDDDPAPAEGWTAIVNQNDGLKIEVRFTQGTMRVDVHIELEYGQVRERVRTRDRADDSETRFENDVLTRTEPGSDDSNSGPGSNDDGSDDDGSDDDNDDSDDDDGPDDSSDD